MASSDDEWDTGGKEVLPVLVGGGESDWDIGGNISDVESGGEHVSERKQRRKKECQVVSNKSTCVFLVKDDKITESNFISSKHSNLGLESSSNTLSVVGVAIIGYRFFLPDEPHPFCEDYNNFRIAAMKRRRNSKTNFGYLAYEGLHVYSLDQEFPLERDELDASYIAADRWQEDLQFIDFQGKSLTQISSDNETELPTKFITVGPKLADLLLHGHSDIVQVTLLAQRQVGQQLLPGFPGRNEIGRWLKSRKTVLPSDDGGVDKHGPLYKLPNDVDEKPMGNASRFKKPQNVKDPLEQISALRFARHLHTTHTVSNALQDALSLARSDSDEEPPDAIQTEKCLSQASYSRNRLKLDSVHSNLTRREFSHLCKEENRGSVSSMHLFSDASPVSGEELQGMVLQVMMKSNELLIYTMPGVMLMYGCCGLVHKVLALLWSLFLLCGPSLLVMSWVIGMIRSCTIDNGTEAGIPYVADCLSTFLFWLCGTPFDACRGFTMYGSRLLRRSLHVTGWSHLLGNAMKRACQHLTCWPRLIAAVRALCRLFRNKSWRKQILRFLAGRVENADKILKHFTAGMVKWRFETVYECLRQLLGVRTICENLDLSAVFSSFQDSALLEASQQALAWNGLWFLMGYFFNTCIKPMEHLRKWGLVCSCPEHIQRRRDHPNKRLECVHNGRRLKHARVKYFSVIDTIGNGAGTWTHQQLQDVGGHLWILEETNYARRMTKADLARRGKWLKSSPFIMAEAEDPHMAGELVMQLQRASDDLSPLEIEYRETFMDDLNVAYFS